MPPGVRSAACPLAPHRREPWPLARPSDGPGWPGPHRPERQPLATGTRTTRDERPDIPERRRGEPARGQYSAFPASSQTPSTRCGSQPHWRRAQPRPVERTLRRRHPEMGIPTPDTCLATACRKTRLWPCPSGHEHVRPAPRLASQTANQTRDGWSLASQGSCRKLQVPACRPSELNDAGFAGLDIRQSHAGRAVLIHAANNAFTQRCRTWRAIGTLPLLTALHEAMSREMSRQRDPPVWPACRPTRARPISCATGPTGHDAGSRRPHPLEAGARPAHHARGGGPPRGADCGCRCIGRLRSALPLRCPRAALRGPAKAGITGARRRPGPSPRPARFG